jgi:molybdate transport system ATP-binding protein
MTRAAVTIEGACLTVGGFSLRDIDLALDTGEILVVLGPNGAGKSVSLEMLAGFYRPAAGRIVINGRDVTNLPPEQRHVGLVFQNFGLFPHLTVRQNVAFGLRAGRWARPSPSDPEIAGLLSQFGIEHLADRGPRHLSPGEKQRVALARALAMRPDLFLLDEPFSALDARTREMLRDELKLFLRKSRVPAIFVTHDEADAFVLADKIAVMHQGEIVQFDAAPEVFRKPASRFVADFIGVENILPGRIASRSGGLCRIAIADRILLARDAGCARIEPPDVSLCIRAEDVNIRRTTAAWRESADQPVNRLRGRVVAVAPTRAFAKVTIDCGMPLVAYLLNRHLRDLKLSPGGEVVAEIEPQSIHVLRR